MPPIKFGNNAIKACPLCDANKQAPVRVGDYITFSGTRARDAQGDFVRAYLVANVGIYTKPGGRAYVSLEESLLGTRGQSWIAALLPECQDRLKVEGLRRIQARRVSVYAVDVAPGHAQGPLCSTARKRTRRCLAGFDMCLLNSRHTL